MSAVVVEADIPPREHQPYSEIRNQLVVLGTALGLFPLSEAIAWTSIFPYMYAMVESFSSDPNGGATDSNTATYAGIMVSVFTFGEFIMAPLWARISDGIGRKSTLLVGSLGAMISALSFGFSISLPMAIATRLLAGLANPNLGVVKTFVGELVDKEHQAKGFSMVSFLRGFGTIIGPVVGGYLAEPVKNYPSLFPPDTVWDKFPYLLPNILVICCLMTSCVLCFLLLEEVHADFRDRVDVGRRVYRNIRNLLSGNQTNTDIARTGYTAVTAFEDDIELESVGGGEEEQKESEFKSLDRRAAFTKLICLQILTSTILGYIKIASLATIPIYLGTPSDPGSATNQPQARSLKMTGGLGLDTQETSHLLLLQAASSIITQILVVPKIIGKWGPLGSYKISFTTLICLFCVMPLASALPKALGITAMVVNLCIYALANGLATTCSSILITNTVPSKAHLATVNGAETSLGCLARTLGPIVSGPLFRLGLKAGVVGLPFWGLAAVSGLGLLVTLFLREHA